jgi:archaellum biogenesis ATPase FlaH
LSDIDTDISLVPTNLQGIYNKIRTFIQENKDCVVLLEGIEFLSTYNNFTSIVKFTQTLNDTVVLNEAILILTINPVAFAPDKFALLKRNTVTVDCMKIDDSD